MIKLDESLESFLRWCSRNNVEKGIAGLVLTGWNSNRFTRAQFFENQLRDGFGNIMYQANTLVFFDQYRSRAGLHVCITENIRWDGSDWLHLPGDMTASETKGFGPFAKTWILTSEQRYEAAREGRLARY